MCSSLVLSHFARRGLALLVLASACSQEGSSAGAPGTTEPASTGEPAGEVSTTQGEVSTTGASTGPGETTSPAAGTTVTDASSTTSATEDYADAVASARWRRLEAAPSLKGGAKQDDVFFLDAQRGFLANGPEQTLYETNDGGTTWGSVFQSSPTFFRALLFLDDQHGFAGNLGAGLSPQITDTNVLYETNDGGATWTPNTAITGAPPQGICNFTASDDGHIFAVGRANGPSHLMHSDDEGTSWTSVDLGGSLMMAIDAHFTSGETGVIGGMGLDGHCTVVRTTDGGQSTDTVFRASAPSSLCWKLHFPSQEVGYVAIQETAAGAGSFARTADGGQTWDELPLPDTGSFYPAIGIGFITDELGWIVSSNPSLPAFRTLDGGTSWTEDPDLRGPINRFRFVDTNTAYAAGADVWKLDIEFDGA